MLRKIGAVSKISGVSAPTLRIWESRHATFEPRKATGNHRLYSEDDMQKPSLLKRLLAQGQDMTRPALNALGSALVPCSSAPLTGYYRHGCCKTGANDTAGQVICAEVTQEFLDCSVAVGNDLLTQRPA